MSNDQKQSTRTVRPQRSSGLFALSLGKRIFGGFAVVLVLLAVLAGVGLRGIDQVSVAAARVSLDSIRAAESTEVALLVDEARALVTQFGRSATVSDQTAAREGLARLTRTVGSGAPGQGSRLSALTIGYVSAVEAEVASIEARRMGIEAIRATATDLRTIVSAIVIALDRETDEAVLRAGARVGVTFGAADSAIWRFVASHTPADTSTANSALQDLQQATQSLATTAADNRRMQRFINGMAEPFDRLNRGLQSLIKTDEDMRVATAARETASAAVLDLTSQHRREAAVSQREAIAAMTGQTATARQLSLLTSAGAIGLGLLLAVMIGRGIARPIIGLTVVMRQLAGGDAGITVPARGGKDEIAAMAEAVEVFRCNAVETARLVAERETVRAAKERRQAAMDRHVQEFGESIGGVMANLTASAAEMHRAAEAVSVAAGRTRTSAETTEQEAAMSSRELEAVAAAAEQMSGSIAEISRQACMVTQAVHHAAEQATITDHKVAGLAETASQIGQVARLISDIAGRTNLLALNATIEAARAGEAGKGFAVVAGEVKALATQTARATDQIGSQISGIRGTTSEAVKAVDAATRSIEQVEATAAAIAAAVEQQSAATREIAGNAQSVKLSSGRAASAMQAVLAVADESRITSQMVLSAAEDVGRTADTLREEVQQFLRAMVDSNENQQRRYERIPGCGSRATLCVQGRVDVELTIRDISRGGVALVCDWPLNAGSEAALLLPGASSRVAARVCRVENGVLALTVRQDISTLAQVDQALDTIGRLTQARAA